MKTTKPYQVIYITGIITPTTEDGDVLTLLALDDFSKFMFPPKIIKKMLNRLKELKSFTQKEIEQVYFNLDAVIREIKNRKTYSL